MNIEPTQEKIEIKSITRHYNGKYVLHSEFGKKMYCNSNANGVEEDTLPFSLLQKIKDEFQLTDIIIDYVLDADDCFSHWQISCITRTTDEEYKCELKEFARKKIEMLENELSDWKRKVSLL